MTTTALARLNDMVRISAPGALDGMIRMAMFDTLQEFFQRSDSWLMEIAVPICYDTNDYQIDTGQNAIVNRLMALERPCSPPPPNQLWPPGYVPTCPPQYLSVSESAQIQESQNPLFRIPREGVLLNAGVKCPILRILLNPQANEMWIATLSLNVSDPVDPNGFPEPPDWLIEKYRSGLASGIICRLMIQPGKPYSSVQGAQYHGRVFNTTIGTARTEVRRMFGYGAQRWTFPKGWRASRPRLPSGQML